MVVSLLRPIVQGPVLEHPPPDQPVKVDPASAEAVRVTLVPIVKFAWHVEPQLIPGEVLVTVPLPIPDLAIARLYCGCCRLNVATTVLLSSIVTEHIPALSRPPTTLQRLILTLPSQSVSRIGIFDIHSVASIGNRPDKLVINEELYF